MERGFLLLFVLICCISADTDTMQDRDMLIRKAVVTNLYQIDITAGEWVDSFTVVSVDTLSERAYLNMWTERIQLAMMFTERRLMMHQANKQQAQNIQDSISVVRAEIQAQLGIQKQQLDSCKKVMKRADRKKEFGYLATAYRRFKGPNGIFLKGDGQYLITKELVAEPYYKHNDTTRLLNDFILESRRYMKNETPD